jgi:hypothetical protein
MADIDNARAQREALDSIAARNAAGVERRHDALRTYLTAMLYDEDHQPRPPDETTGAEAGTETDPEAAKGN